MQSECSGLSTFNSVVWEPRNIEDPGVLKLTARSPAHSSLLFGAWWLRATPASAACEEHGKSTCHAMTRMVLLHEAQET